MRNLRGMWRSGHAAMRPVAESRRFQAVRDCESRVIADHPFGGLPAACQLASPGAGHASREAVCRLARRVAVTRSLRGWTAVLPFEALDLALDQLADENGAALAPDQPVDALAQPFGQTNHGRFHAKRWPSHAGVVAKRGSGAIESRVTDIAY